MCATQKPTLSSAPGSPARKLVATVASASRGQAVNQSSVVQLTRDGNLRSRSRKASPTGLKLSTMCRLRRTWGIKGKQNREGQMQHSMHVTC